MPGSTGGIHVYSLLYMNTQALYVEIVTSTTNLWLNELLYFMYGTTQYSNCLLRWDSYLNIKFQAKIFSKKCNKYFYYLYAELKAERFQQ